MFCSHCGTMLAENVSFCGNCGTPQHRSAEVAENSTTEQFDHFQILEETPHLNISTGQTSEPIETTDLIIEQPSTQTSDQPTNLAEAESSIEAEPIRETPTFISPESDTPDYEPSTEQSSRDQSSIFPLSPRQSDQQRPMFVSPPATTQNTTSYDSSRTLEQREPSFTSQLTRERPASTFITANQQGYLGNAAYMPDNQLNQSQSSPSSVPYESKPGVHAANETSQDTTNPDIFKDPNETFDDYEKIFSPPRKRFYQHPLFFGAIIFIVIAGILLFNLKGNEQSTPEKTIKAYLNAYSEYDIKKMKTYHNPDTLVDHYRFELINFKITNIEIDGNKAIVDFEFTIEEIDDYEYTRESTLHMIRKNGKWYIDEEYLRI